MRFKFLVLILAFLSAHSSVAAAEPVRTSDQKKLTITRLTPSGLDVPAQRQMVFQFNRPVVPIGRMEREADEIPVEISPPLACEWRWINTSALACQLNEENTMREATEYAVVMHPGIQAEDGATLAADFTHRFTTERPQIHYAWFSSWRSPGTPVIRLTFNQSVSRTSVQEALRFMSTAEAEAATTFSQPPLVEPDPEDREHPRYISVPGESYVLDFGPDETGVRHVSSDDDPRQVGDDEARRVWLVSPQQELPLDRSVDLFVKPGLLSAFGKETGVENRIVLNFHTFPEFEFLGVSCTTNDEEAILITAENSASIGSCNPLRGTALAFSAPVVKSQVKEYVQFEPDLAGGRSDYDPWANQWDDSRLGEGHQQGSRYEIWLPEYLKAAEQYHLSSKQIELGWWEKIKAWWYELEEPGLEDEFGRHLKQAIDLRFLTDHRLPNFELVHRTAVLESQSDSDVPLYVTNLDQVSFQYKKLTVAGSSDQLAYQNHEATQAQDIQFAIPLHIRDVLGASSGAVYGSVETQPPVSKHFTERLLFATLTPYQVHVKAGHYNTLVWVTDLATGQAVADAQVQIYQDQISRLSSDFQSLDQGITDAEGLVRLKGSLELDPDLKLFDYCDSNNQDDCDRLFIRVDKQGEMALLPLDYRFEVNPYRASNYTVWAYQKKQYGHIHTWGTTAQGIYRAGSTIQYKFYVRDQDNDRYVPAPRGNYQLEIIDPTGKTVHQVDALRLNEFGSYSGEFTVAESAAVGWYQFKLSADFTDQYSWEPLRVLVSDFTPAPFKVVNNLNGDLFQPEQNLAIATAAKLHSGGAYTNAEVRVTVNLSAAYFSSKHPQAAGFVFDSYHDQSATTIYQNIDTLNAQGEIAHQLNLPREDIVYGRLSVESAVRDDRGKYIASTSRADYVAVDRLVGLKHSQWLYHEDEPAEIHYLVVDERGTPAAGTAVTIKIERLETKAAQVKGAGNAYLTNYIDEWVAYAECEGVSKTEPLSCQFTSDTPGSYKLTANISDTQGHAHSSETYAWVAGKGRVVWREPSDDTLQMIAEKAEYSIGERARYLIKNPYPGAQALITIERYGVLKSWVQELTGSTPVIEFDVEKDFMPGFYLSVMVFSPRVAAPPPEMGQIDLGKPAYKIAYLQVPVKDPYKQMDVRVSTDAEVYKPRAQVTATIHAEPKHQDQQEAIELAVVVLDESVLDLVQGGTDYFDPYQGFYQLDELDVHNYSLLTQLLGRQKFEKKGANPGGDGGAELSVRSLFKYVSYWNPSITPDAQGNAVVRFEVPDNLTGWRVLVLAVTPTDRMGLGQTSFKVNRPTEIRPVMPNQITEGDRFQAGFNVMNRSAQARDLSVTIEASGDLQNTPPYSQQLHLEAYQRQSVFMPIRSASLPQTRDLSRGKIHFVATARDAIDGDGVEHDVPVLKRRSLETAANYGSTTETEVSESLLFPQQIHTDVGEVAVVLAASVIGNIDGTVRYMRDYPYSNWEQRLSKATVAAHYQNLRAYFADDLTWEESAQLPRELLEQAANFQAPNGGMTYYIPADQYVSPYLSAYTALVFNWLRNSGYSVPQSVESKLQDYLQRLLQKDVVPSFYSPGMSATVRAVALAALAQRGQISLNDLERYHQHVPQMSLFGKAHYLQAALAVAGAESIVKEVSEAILAHASQSGGKFSFNEVLDDSYTRILATPLRSNCAILSALTEYAQSAEGASVVSDVPFKLVRSITQTRGKRDHWENTQENIFCLNALVDYSRIYEREAPAFAVNVALNAEAIGSARFNDVRDPALTLSRPIQPGDPGSHAELTLTRNGSGRLYYAAQMSYATLEEHAQRLNAGIDLRREYSVERDGQWVLLTNPSEIKRGELIRVDLYLSLPTARNFVVVDDPVPGGLEPVNRDLANASTVDADKAVFQAAGGSWWFQFNDWHHFNVSRWSFYHQELRHNAVRFYSEYLPAGNYYLSYTAQAIAEGEFVALPVHAEEMYDPDVFGKGLPGTFSVVPAADKP